MRRSTTNSFEGGPLGPWPFKFTYAEDLGCLPTVIGFILFLIVAAVLSRFLF